MSVAPEREYRQIPTVRWASRLGVSRFDNLPEFIGTLEAKRVEIPVSTHIGKPALAALSSGELVSVGEKIADAAEGLSVDYHASIGGKASIGANKIIIDKVM